MDRAERGVRIGVGTVGGRGLETESIFRGEIFERRVEHSGRDNDENREY